MPSPIQHCTSHPLSLSPSGSHVSLYPSEQAELSRQSSCASHTPLSFPLEILTTPANQAHLTPPTPPSAPQPNRFSLCRPWAARWGRLRHQVALGSQQTWQWCHRRLRAMAGGIYALGLLAITLGMGRCFPPPCAGQTNLPPSTPT